MFAASRPPPFAKALPKHARGPYGAGVLVFDDWPPRHLKGAPAVVLLWREPAGLYDFSFAAGRRVIYIATRWGDHIMTHIERLAVSGAASIVARLPDRLVYDAFQNGRPVPLWDRI